MANEYLTAEADIEIQYEHDASITFTILDADSVAYSFTNKTDSDLSIYEYEGGALVKNYGESATEGISYVANAITWNMDFELSGLEKGRSYYYEITYEDSGTTNSTIKVVDGKLTVE